MELVTGYAGKAHITAIQSGALNAGIVGSGSYVFNTGEKLSASVITNNLIRILDGDLIANGRHITIAKGTYEEVEIANGLQGVKRNDLICARYVKNADSGIESASLVVIQGTSTQGTPIDPEYNDNNILDGTLISDFPLYRITLDGLNVGEPEKLFTVIKNINDIQGDVAGIQKNIGTIEGDIDALNSNLDKKQNLLARGVFTGNIDTDIPSNSITWCNSNETKGTIPAEGYFQLHDFASFDDLHYQHAVYFNNNNAPIIYTRLYCNTIWSEWDKLVTNSNLTTNNYYHNSGVVLDDGDGGYIEGGGTVTMTIVGNIARIDFSIRINKNNTPSDFDSVRYGINRNLLVNLGFPKVTPLTGGSLFYYGSDGTISNDMTYMGGIFDIMYDEYWTPSRIYNEQYVGGPWQSRALPVSLIMRGTCYGRVE